MNYGASSNFNLPYPNYSSTNFNANPMSSTSVTLCNLCKGSGYYINNGMNIPCQCGQFNPNLNYNYNH